MKFTTTLLTLALSALSVNAVAIDSAEHSLNAKIFRREITARDDPCLTPCYEKTGSYCPSPSGCGLQWYVGFQVRRSWYTDMYF
jgi:hypothetical protein